MDRFASIYCLDLLCAVFMISNSENGPPGENVLEQAGQGQLGGGATHYELVETIDLHR